MNIERGEAFRWGTIGVLATVSMMGVSACSSDEDGYTPSVGPVAPPHVNGIYPLTTLRETPQDFVDAKGHRWTHMGPARFVDEGGPAVSADAIPPAPRTREELARALRGVMLFNGHEYQQLEPAYDLVDRAALMTDDEISFEGRPSRDPGSDETVPAVAVDGTKGCGSHPDHAATRIAARGGRSVMFIA